MVGNASLPITVTQVTKRYGKTFALDHVDLSVRSGEFLTLLGPSGSGKTTLLNVMAGFTRPDSGSLQFGEQEMINVPPHKREVGMVFQNYALFPHMTVAANVGFALRLRGIKGVVAAERVERALDMVRLGGFGARGVDQLSGGQRQRVALARAIVFEPRIMLMDEPLSALDKQLREHMQIELRHLHEQLGMTTVYVTHDQREALTMSDRIAVIQSGRIMQLAEPRAIYERPANRFEAEFIGESTFVSVDVVGTQIYLAGTALRSTQRDLAQGKQLLMLRPERLQVVLATEQAAPDANVFEAKLVRAVYQGDSLLLEVALGDGTTLQVRQPTVGTVGRQSFESGQSLRLALSAEDTVILSSNERAA